MVEIIKRGTPATDATENEPGPEIEEAVEQEVEQETEASVESEDTGEQT